MRVPLCLLLIALTARLSAKMVVQGPPELAEYFRQRYGDEGLPYGIANYGLVPYGKTISG